jgi:hypothetical protein
MAGFLGGVVLTSVVGMARDFTGKIRRWIGKLALFSSGKIR